MESTRWYLATDRYGVQHLGLGEVRWRVSPPGSPFEEATAESSDPPIELVAADGLLDRLDERIFSAEPAPGSGPAPGSPGQDGPGEGRPAALVVGSARLVAELAWGSERAAGFALDALEHAFADELDLDLPRGYTVGSVLSEARSALASAGGKGGAFTALGRLARLRQLKRLRQLLGTTALGLAKEDEREDLDVLDDPAWATLAALGEGVLAALETLRSALAHRYIKATEDREAPEARSPRVFDVQTPWGALALGAEHVPDHPPAARSAREALERARQAVGDRDGDEALRRERAWQADALERLLLSGGS